LDQNGQHLNVASLSSDRGEVTAAFITACLSGTHFKGIQCVGLEEMSSAGLKLIGLISALSTSCGHAVGGALVRIFKLPGSCFYPFPVPL